MDILSILLLALIALWGLWAVRYLVKGGCCGAGKNGGCRGSCNSCCGRKNCRSGK